MEGKDRGIGYGLFWVMEEGEAASMQSLDHFTEQDKRPSEDSKSPAGVLHEWRHYVYFGAVFLFVFFLAIASIYTFSLYRDTTQEEFNGMIEETLDAYIVAQKKLCLGKIVNVEDTLKAYEALISDNPDPDYIEYCMNALNKADPTILFQFSSAEYFQEVMQGNRYSEADIKILDRLRNGESIVSNVRYSKRLGDGYYYAVAVPVMHQGEFVGALRGIMDANELVSMSQFPPSQGRVIDSFLTDGKGNMIPVQTNGSDDWDTVYDYLAHRNDVDISLKVMEELPNQLYRKETETISLGEWKDTPVYLSITELEYNDLHLAVLLYADKAQVYSENIVRSTAKASIYFILFLLLLGTGLLLVFRKMHKRITEEERRYMLLGKFSDTVLFDYDCRSDIIHFTDNAKELFRMKNLIQRRFLRRIGESSIYAEDLGVVRKVLTGNYDGETKEVRIRIQQNNKESYQWFLVQFRYLYGGKTVISVIGKIMDIDQQKRREDALMVKSTMDGLTGLCNRAALEERIGRCLEESDKGMLLVIDIDDFKQINDRCGHQMGDEVLRCISETMNRMFRSQDVLGRMGGDELVAYICGTDDREVAKGKVDGILRELEEYSADKDFTLSVSVGVACYPKDGTDYKRLFEAADEAMYQAKSTGKGRCSFFEG